MFYIYNVYYRHFSPLILILEELNTAAINQACQETHDSVAVCLRHLHNIKDCCRKLGHSQQRGIQVKIDERLIRVKSLVLNFRKCHPSPGLRCHCLEDRNCITVYVVSGSVIVCMIICMKSSNHMNYRITATW